MESCLGSYYPVDRWKAALDPTTQWAGVYVPWILLTNWPVDLWNLLPNGPDDLWIRLHNGPAYRCHGFSYLMGCHSLNHSKKCNVFFSYIKAIKCILNISKIRSRPMTCRILTVSSQYNIQQVIDHKLCLTGKKIRISR